MDYSLFNGIDPRMQGILAGAAAGLEASGPSRMPVSLGQVMSRGLLSGMGAYNSALAQQNKMGMEQAQLDLQKQGMDINKSLRDAQIAQIRMQQEEAQRRAAEQQRQREYLQNLFSPQAGLAEGAAVGDIGPTVTNAQRQPTMTPDRLFQMAAMGINPEPFQKAMDSARPRFQAVGDQLVQLPSSPGGSPTVAFTGQQKAPEGFTRGPNGLVVDPEYLRVRKEIAGAGRTSVTVQPDSLGLKPKDKFDMEKALRGDFSGNPVIKAADEMNSAFRLIETAKQNPSPANDLAMATKYMKILDPNSVVRESELALAMNATGVLDRMRNYADMLTKGYKLTPQQRTDFYNSAKAINDNFQQQRQAIAQRFSQNATQYNLSPENVVGTSMAGFRILGAE